MEEIGFEEFLIVMSYFRAPALHITEEQIEEIRRAKLRCKNIPKHLNEHDIQNILLKPESVLLLASTEIKGSVNRDMK